MKQWLEEMLEADKKKPLPILSFPCVSLLGISVKELISDAQKQAQGMYLVAQKTDAAASVSLMDLSVEAECFGAQIRVSDHEVPTVIGQLIDSPEAAEELKVPQIGSGRTGIFIDAIKNALDKIDDRPILAGIIGPFSLAARLLDVTNIMIDCYDEPEMVHTVLQKVTDFLIAYAKEYKKVGANGIVMAEPVAGLLSPALEAEFSAPYVKQIVDSVQDDEFILVYHNCGNNTLQMVDSMMTTGCAAYHFGNAIDMGKMLELVPENTICMGNIDPAGVLKMGNPEIVREETLKLMEKCSKYKNFVVSSGCDIPPMTPWENIDAFFAAVDEYYGK